MCCANLTSGHAEGQGHPGDADQGQDPDLVEGQGHQEDAGQGRGHGKVNQYCSSGRAKLLLITY